MLKTLFILLVTIVSYNTENLFDTRHDSLHNDREYTPNGARHWTYKRYKNKTEQIARVICTICEDEVPAAVGLCEVENDFCMKGLCYQLKHYGYKGIHFESEDERGIDVALLYDPHQLEVVDSVPLKVDLGDDKTRDILHVTALRNNQEVLHLFVCHLPSMVEGQAASEWKRQQAKDVVRHATDSILADDPTAAIVVMGDMNSGPQEDIRGLTNLMFPIAMEGLGTHRFKGIWTCLDQFYVSESLSKEAEVHIYDAIFLQEKDPKYLGYRPRRTFNGFHYQPDGFSDHLPIILRVP